MKEIIWEFTLKCSKGCDFCGSKDVLNSSELSNADKIKVAESIADYHRSGCGPNEVTLSGGEPSETDSDTLWSVLKILKEAGIVTKMLTNGCLFKQELSPNLDVVGYSVNTVEDTVGVNFLFENPCLTWDRSKITMITNFGKHNIWDYDTIAKAADFFGCWQVQLTEGGGLNLPPSGIKMLRDQLRLRKNTVMADNLAFRFKCQAGKEAMGILADGHVVPCLSMRCWKKDLSDVLLDSMTKLGGKKVPQSSIADAWETDPFIREYRFGRKEACCRDCFEYPSEEKASLDIPMTGKSYPYPPVELEYPTVDIYGVQVPYDPPIVTMYAVTIPDTGKYTPSWSNTSSNMTSDTEKSVHNMSKIVYGVFQNGKRKGMSDE